MKLKQLHILINSEGDILSILKNDSNEMYVMANTNNGVSQIICKTNQFIIELYLKSRISLQQIYLLSQSSHFIIKTGKKAEAKFFEITSEQMPEELAGISCGNDLFHLLPPDMRTTKTTTEIMYMLPAIDDGVILIIDRDITITKSQVQFFSDGSPLQIEQIESESHNPTEFDYISVPLNNGLGSLHCRLSPQLLKIYLSNMISIKELFKCQSDKEYFYSNDKGINKLFYTDGLEGLIDKLTYGNLTYYSLPAEYIIENPIETWDYYTKNTVISGHGVLPSEFEKEYPVEIKIERA